MKDCPEELVKFANRPAEAVLCVAGPDTRTERYDDQIVKVRHAVRWVRYGAECYGYGLLASGFVDLMVDAGLDNHDFGPLEPIVRNAGGVATDWDGRALSMDSSGEARLIEQVRAHLERCSFPQAWVCFAVSLAPPRHSARTSFRKAVTSSSVVSQEHIKRTPPEPMKV